MTDRESRVAKALAEVHYVQTLLGPHHSAEAVLAAEVRRLQFIVAHRDDRARAMLKAWRDVVDEQRACAEEWRSQGEAFAWHAIRAAAHADIIETQAKLLESLLGDD